MLNEEQRRSKSASVASKTWYSWNKDKKKFVSFGFFFVRFTLVHVDKNWWNDTFFRWWTIPSIVGECFDFFLSFLFAFLVHDFVERMWHWEKSKRMKIPNQHSDFTFAFNIFCYHKIFSIVQNPQETRLSHTQFTKNSWLRNQLHDNIIMNKIKTENLGADDCSIKQKTKE